MKRSIQVLTFVLLMPLAFSSFAQIERFVAGTHYTELAAPANTNDASKIEGTGSILVRLLSLL